MSSPHRITYPAYRPNVMGLNGAVTSGHPLASQAGLRILQAGGNAMDAAIATAAALGVVELPSSGVGGDGFLMFYDAASRRVHGVNGTGPAPSAATREYYVERGGIPMKGILSVSVPGIVDGWLLAHRPFGRLELAQVLAPAIELCEQGFPVSHKLSATLQAEHERFAGDPYTRAIFAPQGKPLAPGDILYQSDLGQTLRAIAEGGRAAFYEGVIAGEIARFMEEYGGLLTRDDLAAFNARRDEPIHVDYHGHRVYEMPPNSSGHVLLQELNLVEQFDLASMGCLTAESVHIMVEAKKLAFADREAHVADPDWRDIPLERLLSKEYAAERAALIDTDRVNPEVTTGIPEAKEDTTCFTVADGEGKKRGLRSAEHPVRSRVQPDRRKNRHPAEQPYDLLAPGGGPPQLPGSGKTGAPHHESGHRHEDGRSGNHLRHPWGRYPGPDQFAVADPRDPFRHDPAGSGGGTALAQPAKSSGIHRPPYLRGRASAGGAVRGGGAPGA